MATKQSAGKAGATVAVRLQEIKTARNRLTICGTTPMLQHAWDHKAIEMIEAKKMGKKTKDREACDPEREFKAATYFTPEGEYGIPLLALKSAIINAAHKDLGIEKTLVRKALFIRSPNLEMILPMAKGTPPPKMRKDMVRVGAGSADVRYRPQFDEWKVTFDVEYDTDLLQLDDLVNLINRAGFGVGIGEWRPEKNGEYGRFEVLRAA